nr:hypothetical protein [Tanacetum cinerariifolium]
MEEDDDAEIIFPYEVQGDQTPPPRDESSDAEPEAEEADDEPEAEDADDELEVEEASVEPEAEEADVELEPEEPDGVPEAVIGAGSQRPFAIQAKIGKMEREILHHDLSSVEETLGKVVEKLKVLENEENTTLRKKLAEKEVLLDLTRMEQDKAERRLSES